MANMFEHLIPKQKAEVSPKPAGNMFDHLIPSETKKQEKKAGKYFQITSQPTAVVPEDNTRSTRAAAKGVLNSVAEIGAIPFRLGGTVATLAIDREGRIAQTEAVGDFSTLPGFENLFTDEYKSADFGTSKLDMHWQEGVSKMKESLTDFFVDLIPSLVDDDWKPQIENHAEEQARMVVEEWAMAPVNALSFVPRVIGEAVSDATGDRLLGTAAELAAFGPVVKGVYTPYKLARGRKATRIYEQKMKELRELTGEKHEAGWEQVDETDTHVVVKNDKGKVVEVEKAVDPAHTKEKVKSAQRSEDFKEARRQDSHTLVKASEEQRLAVQAINKVFGAEDIKTKTKAPKVERTEKYAGLKKGDLIRNEDGSVSQYMGKKKGWDSLVRVVGNVPENLIKRDFSTTPDVTPTTPETSATAPEGFRQIKTKRGMRWQKRVGKRWQFTKAPKLPSKLPTVPTPTPTFEQPKPPQRLPTGEPYKTRTPVRGATGQWRHRKGKVFGPDGRLYRGGLSWKEAQRMVEEFNHSEQMTGEAMAGLSRFDRTVVDRSIDYESESQRLVNKGIGLERQIRRLQEVYHSMPVGTRDVNKVRYNEVLGGLRKMLQEVQKPLRPISDKSMKPTRADETVRAAEPTVERGAKLEQLVEGKKYKERTPRQKKVKDDVPVETKKSTRKKQKEFIDKAIKVVLDWVKTEEQKIMIEQWQKLPPNNLKNMEKHLESIYGKADTRLIMDDVYAAVYGEVAGEVPKFEEQWKTEPQPEAVGIVEGEPAILEEATPERVAEAKKYNESLLVPEEQILRDMGMLDEPVDIQAKKKVVLSKAPRVEPVEIVNTVDQELAHLQKQMWGQGDIEWITERQGGNDIIPYETNIDNLRSAWRDSDGNILVGRGNADSHSLLASDFGTPEQKAYWAQNQASARGWVDPHGRFISMGEYGKVVKSGGGFYEAFEAKYGKLKPTGKEAMRTTPEEPAALTNEQAAEYTKKLDWSEGAAWDMIKDVEGDKIHVIKEAGQQGATVKVNDFTLRGKKAAKALKDFMKVVGTEKGEAMILKDIALEIHEYANAVPRKGKAIADWFKSRFTPAGKSRVTRETWGIFRHKNAQLDIANERLKGGYKAARKQMAKWSQDTMVEFIRNMENGRHDLQITPEMQQLSRIIRTTLDKNWAEVVALGGAATVKENYFPHYWDFKDPSQVSRISARNPMAGTQRFKLKQSIATFEEGLNRGLKPLSYNPIDHFLWKMQETNKFIAGKTIMNEMIARGDVRFWRTKEKNAIPPGWEKLEDPIAKVGFFDKKKKHYVEKGFYIAPTDIARLFHNYLKPGFFGQGYHLYDALRYGNNLMNFAQLGLSGFHFMFTAIDSLSSSVSLGVDLMLAGAVKEGVGHAVKGVMPWRPIQSFVQGKRLRKALYSIDPVNAAHIEFFRELEEAGGGVHLEKYYDLGEIAAMKKAFEQKKWLKGSTKIPIAAIELVGRGIMNHWVPNLKLALAYDMFKGQQVIWAKKGIQPTLTQRRLAYGTIWDSIDNRVGQLRYDNLGIKRSYKDAGMLFYRALGWNIGSIREFAGGTLIDIPKAGKAIYDKVVNQKAPDWAAGERYFGQRLTYTATLLALVIPAYTLALECLLTGRNPFDVVEDEDHQWWHAKNGRTNPDGSPQYVSLASYAKDVASYFGGSVPTSFKDLMRVPGAMLKTTGHKMSPILHLGFTTIENRRYDGEIMFDWSKIDSPTTLLGEAGKFGRRAFVDNFTPFSYRNIQMQLEKQGGFDSFSDMFVDGNAGTSLMTFLGVVPSPLYAIRTVAENKAAEYAQRVLPKGPFDPETIEKRKKKTKFIRAWQRQDKEQMDKIIAEGTFTRSQLKNALKRSIKPRLISDVLSMEIHNMKEVLRWATIEEAKELMPHIGRRIKNSRSLTRPAKVKMWTEIKAIYKRKGGEGYE